MLRYFLVLVFFFGILEKKFKYLNTLYHIDTGGVKYE